MTGPALAASSKAGPGQRVTVITMTRTGARNALSVALCERLTDLITAATAQPDTRAIVLATAGEDFCAGADLKERLALDESGLRRARVASTALTRVLLRSPVPVIAAARGFILGGGLELALAGDLIVAEAATTFGFPETGIGIVPGGGGTQLLARRIGWGRALDMVLTGRRIDAEHAFAIGLVDRPPSPDPAVDTALGLAAEISGRNPNSVRLVRAAMRDGAGLTIKDALAVEDRAWRTAAFSADYREGLAAFGQRRRPAWNV